MLRDSFCESALADAALYSLIYGLILDSVDRSNQ